MDGSSIRPGDSITPAAAAKPQHHNELLTNITPEAPSTNIVSYTTDKIDSEPAGIVPSKPEADVPVTDSIYKLKPETPLTSDRAADNLAVTAVGDDTLKLNKETLEAPDANGVTDKLPTETIALQNEHDKTKALTSDKTTRQEAHDMPNDANTKTSIAPGTTDNDNLVKGNNMNPDKTLVTKIPATNSVFESKPTDQSSTVRSESFETDAGVTGESVLHNVMLGQCLIEHLPPMPKKVVRIFVSSTFTDTKEERNALMQNVYPRLADYCRAKHGLEFQIVDMRWGVPEQASDNHSTTDLCIQEIHKCQQVSVGPNFVAIVGDRYGFRPIPSTLEECVFNALREECTLEADTKHAWVLVDDWYQRDENAVPPLYVLQPISCKIPHYSSGTSEQRNEAWKQWKHINQTLQHTLRLASDWACNKHTISQSQHMKFFMSVTENEITEGMLADKTRTRETCFCIMRNIKDIDQHIDKPTWSRFTDVTNDNTTDQEALRFLNDLKNSKIVAKLPESNLTKVDIEWSYSGACISLEDTQDMDVAKYAQAMLKDRQLKLFKHREYLDAICADFFKRISRMIQQGSIQQSALYDELTTEVLQHWHLAKLRCEIFEGRQDILTQAKTFCEDSVSSGPLVIYGNSGCGKTSVMAKIMENITNGEIQFDSKPVLICRFLGTTSYTSNLHQLILKMCNQIALAYDVQWTEPDGIAELVKSFQQLLSKATSDKPMVVLLDSIDQLLPTYNAYKLAWIPLLTPNHVKIIASTIEEDYPILSNLKERYGTNLKTILVEPLGEQLGLQIISKWLVKGNRTMTTQQQQVISAALSKCSLPLYARIAFDHIVKWKSYDIPSTDQLETTIKGAINKLLHSMEEKFGPVVVKHCLGYLTASRNGLSESELEHLLSMDDVLLGTVFRLWNPPVRRIPPLIWTRVRNDVNNYIVERSADDTLVLYWYHRQFIQTTKQRYLSDDKQRHHFHSHLADYFSGKWSEGREKPFVYTEAQMKRFGLSSPNSAADRKLPAQPYKTHTSQHGSAYTWYNKRKMSELPFHLVRCKNYDDLKTLVFFNFEWLYSKIKGSSVQQMLEEFEVFMQSDKTLKKDSEMKLLYVNLQLVRPYILRYPESLSYELQGRLAKFIATYTGISSLIQQCDMIGRSICPIVPLVTCFETADLGFTQNMNFRNTEPWQEGGTFSCSKDFKTAYIIDYNENGAPVMLLWDIATGEKITQVSLNKTKSEKAVFLTDIYRHMCVVKGGKQVIAFCQVKDNSSYMKQIKRDIGYVDVIDVETGDVIGSYESFTYKDEFMSPLLYVTDNFLCTMHGWKRPLINITRGESQSYNKISHLSANEKYFIYYGKDKLSLREHESKELIADFDVSEHQMAVVANDIFTIIAMIGVDSKDISIFDLWTKRDNLKPRKQFSQLFKPKHVFKLDERTKGLVETVFKPTMRDIDGQNHVIYYNKQVNMQIAPNNRHLMVTFIGTKWMSFMWGMNIYKYNAKFIGQITPNFMNLSSKFPQFSFDGSTVVYTTKRKKIVIVDSETADVVNDYELQEEIKDFCTSQADDRVAVMLQKSIVILNIRKATNLPTQVVKGKKPGRVEIPDILVEREIDGDVIYKEVIIQQDGERVVIEEVDDLAEAVDTDRVASARSKRQHAIEKHLTPDGSKTVHYHARVQVVDTKLHEVKYSPKKGEYILRIQTENGVSSNQVVAIPGLEDSSQRFITLELLQGDRLVNENNKIKFRVDKEPNGQFKIMTVPSALTIYSTEELKLRKVHCINVYNEHVLAVSNNYIVTGKHTQRGHFVNIYSQSTGKLLATHSTSASCDCAEFSCDEAQLFVVDRSLTVRMLLAPTFTAIEMRVVLVATEKSSAFVVKSVETFPGDRNSILVRYGPEGPDVFIRSRYIYLDTLSKAQSLEMNVTPSFQDVSCDGKIAVDSLLNMYDLSAGKITRTIPYTRRTNEQSESRTLQNVLSRKVRYLDASASQLCVRISSDKKYVVFVDKNDSSIHLVNIQDIVAKHVISCSNHAPDLTELSIRHHGRVIVVRSKIQTTYLAISCNGMPKETPFQTSELQRALGLMKDITPKQSKITVPPSSEIEDRSVYQRKLLMQNQMGTITNTDEFVTRKQARRRNIANTLPTALILGQPFLCSDLFKPELFSPNLITQKIMCQSAEDALDEISKVVRRYDTIVIQMITNDVTQWHHKFCFAKISAVIDQARQKTSLVVVALAPCRSDNHELNEKTMKVNEKLEVYYKSTSNKDSHVHFCKNSNLSLGDKPHPKYIPDGLNLSLVGLKRMVLNLKEVIGPHLKMHVI